MGRAPRSELQRQIDYSTVARLKLQGKTFLQIAHAINEQDPRERPYTEAMAKADWKVVFKANKVQQGEDARDAKAIEIMWRDHVEGIIWQEFNASKGTQETRNTEIATVEVPDRNAGGMNTVQVGSTRKRSTMTQKQLLADSKWVYALLQNRDARAKLTGVYEPDRLDITIEGEQIIEHRTWDLEKLERARQMFIDLQQQDAVHQLEAKNGSGPDYNW